MSQQVDNNRLGEYTVETVEGGSGKIQVMTSGLSIPKHDERVLAYTDGSLTSIVYKLATVTVATVTYSYTDGNLTGIVRT